MLRYVFSSRYLLIGFVFFVLTVGGSLLYQQHVQRITEAEFGQMPTIVQQHENQKPVDTAVQMKADPFGDTSLIGNARGDVGHSVPHTPLEDTAKGKWIDASGLQEETDVNFDLPETEVDTEIPWEETASAERLAQKLLKDWEDFSYNLQAKYPVLFDQQAINRVARTSKGRKEIKSQAAAMVDESLDEFERLFSQLPTDFSHAVLDLLEEHFRENSQGIPPKYIDQTLDRMRSRIN